MSVMAREDPAGPGMPPALGPYSPAVRTGQLVFVSAQSGVDPSTDKVPEGGFEAECRQAFLNLVSALKASGSDPADVVKTMVLYANAAHLPMINRIFLETFPVRPPARTAAIVGLAAGRRIAVDAIAVIPG